MKPNSTNSGGKNSPPLPTDSEPIPVNLQDLESAFRFTTTKQLKFQQWIFAIMSNRILNKGAIFFTRLFLTIKIYFPIRLTMYKIFCGGTSI